jgi:hypothetical protein
MYRIRLSLPGVQKPPELPLTSLPHPASQVAFFEKKMLFRQTNFTLKTVKSVSGWADPYAAEIPAVFDPKLLS